MKENKLENHILFITHQLDKSGAPTSLLKIIEHFNKNINCSIEIISMRNGFYYERYKELSNKFFLLSAFEQTSFMRKICSFFYLSYLFIFKIKSKKVLINSAVNLRSMLACILFNKEVYVYVRESENMMQSRLGYFRKMLLSKMSGIICVSKSTKEWVKKYVPEKKIKVIYNGISSPSSPTYNSLTNKSRYKVGIIGKIDLRKGLDRFIALIDAASMNMKPYDFQVIGEVLPKKSYNNLSKKYRNLKITGLIENVDDRIKECDCILMLSREEALPRSVMEAGACGIPVLALDVAGTKEILPTNYPYLLPEDSKMTDVFAKLEMILEKEDKQSIARKNFQHIKKYFNLNKNINSILSLFKMYEK